MYRRGRKNNFIRTIKAYLVPIIGLFLIIILFYSFFSDWKKDNIKDENINNIKTWINLSYDSDDTDAVIILSNWKEEKVKFWSVLSKWEKIKVRSWDVDLSLNWNILHLNKNWILEYKNNWILYLDSSDLWIDAKKPMEVSLKYWNIKANEWSILNLSQNEYESIIYNLKWVVEVENLSWNKTILWEWKQLTISRKDASNTDLDLTSLKLDIEEYFKLWDWYTKNFNKSEIINLDKNSENSLLNNENTSSGETLDSVKNYWKLTFYNLVDESYVNKNEIDISWNYFDDDIAKISVNWTNIPLNKELKTFELEKFKLSWKENDLVFKVFDNNSNILWKKVITIYTNENWKKLDNNTNKLIEEKVENFPVKASDFIIYAPNSLGKFETDTDVTIRWKVTNPNVKSVIVNWYKLKSYNWSTWRYHAFVWQWTLKPWTNNYIIDYLDWKWNIIYKQYYTIIKKLPKVIENKKEIKDDKTSKDNKVSEEKKWNYSDEVKL